MLSCAKTLPLLATLAVGLGGCGDEKAIADLFPTRSYFIASSAMEPNLPPDATLYADLIEAEDAERGDIVIVRHPSGEDYIKRLIGLPGDIVAVSGGVVVLNGERLEQRVIGDYRYEQSFGGVSETSTATRLREKLPGGPSYDILDERRSIGDEFGEIILGDDQYFVLGDNRDNSADSRFPPEARGLGIVSGEQIVRRADLATIER